MCKIEKRRKKRAKYLNGTEKQTKEAADFNVRAKQ